MNKDDLKDFLGKPVEIILKLGERRYKGIVKELRQGSVYFYDFKLKMNIGVSYPFIDAIIPIKEEVI